MFPLLRYIVAVSFFFVWWNHSVEIPELQHLNFDEISNENGLEIGWIKVLSCTETPFMDSEFTLYQNLTALTPYAISMKVVPNGSTQNSNYTSYAITAKPCSNAILALNNNYEVSYTIDPYHKRIDGRSFHTDWRGSQVAKDRLWTRVDDDWDINYRCSDEERTRGFYPRDINNIIYESKCDNNGIDIVQKSNICRWNKNMIHNQDIEVYFGYDANKTHTCNQTQLDSLFWRGATENNITDKLKHVEFDEITSVNEYDIGWIKLISCTEEAKKFKSNFSLHDDYNLETIKDLLPYVVSIRIAPPGNSQTNTEYHKYMVETVPCSNPVFAITNGKEITWDLNQFTKRYNIKDYSGSNKIDLYLLNWIGNNTAKDRLSGSNNCKSYWENGEPRDFPVVITTCRALGVWDALTVDMTSSDCFWDKEELEIEIYFGFDKNKQNVCKFELDEIESRITHSNNFIFVPYSLNGFDAEMYCEQNYNSTLAILNTEDKIMEAVQLRDSTGYSHRNTWIGLYSPANERRHYWQWYGTKEACNIDDCWFDDIARDSIFISYKGYACAYLVSSTNSTIFPTHALSTGATDGRTYSRTCQRQLLPFFCDRFNDPNPETEARKCDFSHVDELNISKAGFGVFNHNITIGDEMTISFEIKLDSNFVCNATRCNIMHIGNDISLKTPSVYIVGDDIEIFMFNGYQEYINYYKHKIFNGLQILGDGNYHRISLEFSKYIRKYIIDGNTHFWNAGFDEIPWSSDENFRMKKHYGETYELFISNPWEQSVDGTMKNLCIETNYDLQTIRWSRLEFISQKDVYLSKYSRPFRGYSLPIAFYEDNIIMITEVDIYYRPVTQQTLINMAVNPFLQVTKLSAGTRWSNNHTKNINPLPANNSIFGRAQFKSYIEYDDNDAIVPLIMYSQQFIQDDTVLYVLMENVTDANGFQIILDDVIFDTMMNGSNFSTTASATLAMDDSDDIDGSSAQIYIFDLDELSLKNTIVIPNDYYYVDFAFYSCIATNHTHLYIINEVIIIYDINQSTFSPSSIDFADFNLIMTGCATTVDNDRIFIFGGLMMNSAIFNTYTIVDTVYEYDIISDTITVLEGITLRHPTYGVRAIATGNNKIYLYGGNTDETGTDEYRSIFDVKSRTFDRNYIDQSMIRISQNKSGTFSTAVYDYSTNLIIRYVSTKKQLELLVVDPTSIDFTVTEIEMWRADVLLDYILNDYTFKSEPTLYKFELNYTNSTDNITKIMVIDESAKLGIDECFLCDSVEWNDDCDTQCVVPVHDTSIDSINIFITSINYNVEVLYSNSLYIIFQKCSIGYEITPKSVKFSDKIFISAHLNALCSSNPLSTNGYIANIYEADTKINHDIIIMNSGDCTICEFDDYTKCVNCSEGITPFIDDELEDKAQFTIILTSKTTDLLISPSSIDINVGNNDLSMVQIAGITSGSSVFCLFITGIILYCCQKNRKLKDEIQRKEKYKQDISNPLVLMIGVAAYIDETEVKSRGIKDIYCNDLDGIDIDFMKMQKLCKLLNYDMYPEEMKLKWTQDEIIALLKETAEKAEGSLSTNDPYDSILVVCSGHGLKHNIITSDYNGIHKDAIHRLFGANYPNLRELPRIFMFDCCDGDQKRSYLPSTYKEDDSDSESDDEASDDKGKNVDPMDVIFKANTEMWKSDELNPDYKLVTIHSANMGFQAKMNSFDGSYLISYFVHKLSESIEQNTNLFFGEIMEQIQQELHHLGKQQSVNTFNNHTRYIRFQKRDLEKVNHIEDVQEIEMNDITKVNSTSVPDNDEGENNTTPQ